MAKIRVYQKIDNNVYIIDFVNDLLALSKTDKDLMNKYGEPEINLGGDFEYGDDGEFTLADEYVKIVSGFPVRREFDITAAPFDEETDDRLTAYRTTILSRITTAFATLRANDDDFTNEFLTSI